MSTARDRSSAGERGRFTGWSQGKAALDARIAAAGHTITRWTNHDLRRTAATGMGELGVEPHVIEAALNHASGFRRGVGGVYNLSRLERQVGQALNLWDRTCARSLRAAPPVTA